MKTVAESAADAQTPPPKPLPRKFYAQAAHENGVLKLDGRPAKTPSKKPLVAPNKIAEYLTFEWNAQVDVINPATMPLTRLLNSIIDGVMETPLPVEDEIIKYAGSDLICYRDGETEALLQRQINSWNPILDQLRTRYSLTLLTTNAISFVHQPSENEAILRGLIPKNPYQLGAFHAIMTLTGSPLITLALYKNHISSKEAWLAAHLDEDFQIERWGEDDEAIVRRKFRLAEFEASLLCLHL